MALRNKRWLALAIMVGLAASCVGAAAQSFYWGDRYPSGRYQEAPPRDYFGFPFFGDRYNRPPPPVDSSKAPPPRKLETPPTTNVVVIGDSFADWLAYGLDETYADQPDVGVVRKIRPTSGLIRYDAKNDQLEWPPSVKDVLATEKPNAIVVMLGLNDRVAIRDHAPPKPEPQRKGAEQPAQNQTPQNSPQGQGAPAPASDSEATPQNSGAAADTQKQALGGSYDFHTDKWAEVYAKRIDEMIAALKSKGVPVIWVGLPAIRGTKATGDIGYLDELYRERAEKAGIIYVDIWDGFVDEQGRYAVQGPDFEGQTRRLRTGDGVHFTKAGAVKLASYVDRDLRRILSSHVTPVALPGPEQTAPKPGGPRPAIGPVLPLTASGGGEGGDLLGGGAHPAPAASDPVATEVLSRGDPLAAPPGRADDFTWPRPGNDVNPADLTPEPVALTPAAPAKKGAPGKNDAKKPADAKNDAKTDAKNDAKNDAKSKPAADTATKTRHSPSASLDGAPPRPPASIGGGF